MPTSPPVQPVRKHGVHGLLYVAKLVLEKGRDLWQENLTAAEREEFTALLAGSKGRRKNLTSDDVARLSRLVVKAVVGKDGLDVGDLISIARRAKSAVRSTRATGPHDGVSPSP